MKTIMKNYPHKTISRTDVYLCTERSFDRNIVALTASMLSDDLKGQKTPFPLLVTIAVFLNIVTHDYCLEKRANDSHCSDA